MRVSPALSLLFVSAAVAATSLQERQSPFPACALTCISNADLGGCVASDTACTCKNTKYVDTVTRCIYANCTGSDLTNSINTAQAICRSVGVTLTSTPVLTSTATSSATGSANSSVKPTQTASSASSSSSSTSNSTSSASSSSSSTSNSASSASPSSSSTSNSASSAPSSSSSTSNNASSAPSSSSSTSNSASSASSSSSSTSNSNDAAYLHINSFAAASALGLVTVSLSFL